LIAEARTAVETAANALREEMKSKKEGKEGFAGANESPSSELKTLSAHTQASQRLSAISEELIAQIRLLKSERQSAEAELAACNEALDSEQQRFKAGVVTDGKVDDAKRRVREAQSRVDRANTLAKLYQDVWDDYSKAHPAR